MRLEGTPRPACRERVVPQKLLSTAESALVLRPVTTCNWGEQAQAGHLTVFKQLSAL